MKKPNQQPDDDDEEDDLEVRRSSYRRERRIIQVHIDEKHPDQRKKPQFYQGEYVSGNLSLEISGGFPVKQVKVALVCLQQIRAAPQIPGISGGSRRKSIFNTAVNAFYGTTTDEHPERKIYFDRKIILQVELLDSDKKLTDGKYELPFRFTIPTGDLPSSVKTTYGLIKYTVEGFTVDENRSESRGEKEILLIMIPNMEQRQLSSGSNLVKKILEPGIILTARLDRKYYIPGDTMLLDLIAELSTDDTTSMNGTTSLDTTILVHQKQILRFPEEEQHQTIERCILSAIQVETTFMDEVISDDGDEHVDPNVKKRRIKIGPLPPNISLSVECPLLVVKYLVRIMSKKTTAAAVDADIPDSMGPPNIFRMEIPFLVTGPPSSNRKQVT